MLKFNKKYFQTFVIDATYDVGDGPAGLVIGLNRICDEAAAAARQGYQLIVLSDKAAGPQR